MKAAAAMLVLLLGGCSATREIASGAVDIRANAESSKGRFEAIGSETASPAPDVGRIAHESAEGVREQDAIIAATERIVSAIPGVQDTTPWWAVLLTRVIAFLAAVGALGVAWYLGVGTLLSRLLWSLGLCLPRRARDDAALARAMLDPERAEGPREYVAARRAADPAFDAAFKRTVKPSPVGTGGSSACP